MFVVPPESEQVKGNQSRDDPQVFYSGPADITKGGSAVYTITANSLWAGYSVWMRLRNAPGTTNIGFNSDCSDTNSGFTSWNPESGVLSRTGTFTVYGCSAGAATIYIDIWQAVPGSLQTPLMWTWQFGTDVVLPKVATPTGLNAGLVHWDSVALSWDAATGASEYNVQHRLSTETEWSEIEDLTGTSTTVTSLTHGQIYYFQVRAKGNGTDYSADWSSWSDSLGAWTVRVSISGLADSVKVNEEETFSVIAIGLNTSREYAMSAVADVEAGITGQSGEEDEAPVGLDADDCDTKVARTLVDEDSSSFIWSVTIVGCEKGTAEITAFLYDRTGYDDLEDFQHYTKVHESDASEIEVEEPSPPPATPTPTPTPTATPVPQPDPPGSVQNAELTAGYQEIEVDWDAPESDGGASITEYQVAYERTDITQTFTTETTTSTSITLGSLVNGGDYVVDVRPATTALETETVVVPGWTPVRPRPSTPSLA